MAGLEDASRRYNGRVTTAATAIPEDSQVAERV
jgi:hypothetical protein